MPRRARSRSRSSSGSRSRSPVRKHRRHSREPDKAGGRSRDNEKERESERVSRHGERSSVKEESRRDSDRHVESKNRRREHDRGRDKDRDRERSASPERIGVLPDGVKPITESDYFQKSDEFRVWLKEDKRKYFDELSGDKARSYFRKFVKAWNKGRLPQKIYEGLAPGSVLASNNTSYKWSFASKIEDGALHTARLEVGKDNSRRGAAAREDDDSNDVDNRGGSGRVHGPTLPTPADITLARELIDSQKAEDGAYKHAKNKKETKERIEELVGPKPVGREGMLEKKALKREGDRAFREKGDEGLEVDDKTLMGGGDSFHAMIARRDMTKRKYDHRQDEKVTAIRERASAMKEKEKATMDMLQQLAKQRFG